MSNSFNADISLESITEPTDVELESMGLTRDEYNTQVASQIEQIQNALIGMFNIRETLQLPEPSDADIDQLIEVFGNIKYYGILYNQFLNGKLVFNIEDGKMQVVHLGDTKISTVAQIPKNRTLN